MKIGLKNLLVLSLQIRTKLLTYTHKLTLYFNKIDKVLINQWLNCNLLFYIALIKLITIYTVFTKAFQNG